VLQTNAHTTIGSAVGAANTAVTVTFAGSAAFSNVNSYKCSAAGTTAGHTLQVTRNTGSQITIFATSGDVIDFICTGN
jgi:hypothetical protein